MAKQINKTNILTIGGVDYSSQISSATIQATVEELDTTCYGDSQKRREGGLTDGSVTINFKPNADLTNLATISALLGSVTAITFLQEPSVSASNPRVDCSALVTQAPTWGGQVGSLMESSVTWPTDVVISYETS